MYKKQIRKPLFGCLVCGGLRSEVIGGVRFVKNRPHDENVVVSASHDFSLKLSYHPPLVLFPRFRIHSSTAAALLWRLLRLIEECCRFFEWCCYCFLPRCHFFSFPFCLLNSSNKGNLLLPIKARERLVMGIYTHTHSLSLSLSRYYNSNNH